ncbi:glutamate receptor 3.7 [Tripterygium wilfordii]|uniref:Glutamate receptor n=1 Tax=Tripterygium wilfordii TaxID=458696 RepID=A0A7J7DI86_TRIWF|nr:glutamate receptor 3.7 isoform X2 [Tripterygium wilfordii]KAF5746062.1 glutamate receptor 3.7 [Tripterygium wilfordii]
MLLGRYSSTMKQRVILNLTILFWVFLYGSVYCQRPAVVNLGAIFTFDSVIGRAAKTAIEAAVADVNADPRVLGGTKLNLIMEDANCSAFFGAIRAFRVIEKEVVAIIGPQSSGIAHMISEIANAVQVPLLSFAATDPTLSALQFPFFLRTTQSDAHQMAAMADLIDYYGWKEVIAIFVDDYYGRNGISALENELEKKMSKILHKLPLPVWFDDSLIVDFLNQSKSLSPRVYVVHVNPDPGLRIFTIAKNLQMMTGNYVWLTSDWLSTTLDSLYPKKPKSLNLLHGVVGLRPHIPKSRQTSAFVYRWKEMLHKALITTELNVYGLYAYDTVWTIAYSIEKFIKEFGNVSFSLNDMSVDTRSTDKLLGKLKVFDGGTLLHKKIMEINFTGLTGQVHFDQDRNVVGYGYDVINIDQMAIRTVGYWTSLSGFSYVPQEIYKEDRGIYNFHMDQKLNNVTWPSGKTETPRGWVIADNGRPLIIGVPKRVSFTEFAMEMPDSHKIQGYCIDIFTESLKLVPYDVPYRFESFGDGHSNPSYDKLVQMVADNVFDLAVGDIAITTNRTKFVDFSQPYAATGLVVVAPIDKSEPNAWVFLQPFTTEMWFTIGAAFVIIGVVIWILEHRVNTDFRGPPRRQFATIFLFSFSTLYKKNKETPLSPLGRMVMVVWLFVLMVITSSYTANLTSILTVQQLSSPITGIDSLIASNLPIGFQVGSFAYSYLTEDLYIHKSRLVPLGSPEEYERALRRGPSDGGVAAIVEELPYVRLFLSNQSDFGITGQSFTKSGWGFAFQRDSLLAVDISTAILKLSENGKLQSLQEKWFCKMGCPEERRQDAEPEKLQLISFWGLYLLCGCFALSTLLLFLLRAIWQFVRYKRKQKKDPSPSSSSPSSRTRHSQPIHNFIDFIDKKEETIKKMFTRHENRQPQPEPGTTATR